MRWAAEDVREADAGDDARAEQVAQDRACADDRMQGKADRTKAVTTYGV